MCLDPPALKWLLLVLAPVTAVTPLYSLLTHSSLAVWQALFNLCALLSSSTKWGNYNTFLTSCSEGKMNWYTDSTQKKSWPPVDKVPGSGHRCLTLHHLTHLSRPYLAGPGAAAALSPPSPWARSAEGLLCSGYKSVNGIKLPTENFKSWHLQVSKLNYHC